MIVRELITRLGFQVNQQQLTQAEKGVQRVKDGAERMASAVRNAMAVFGGGFAVKALLNTADQMQSFRSRLEMLPQTITDSGEAFDVVAQHANEAGMSVEAYAGMYIKLGNAAKDLLPTQESILSVTDTLSKALVVGGASTQEQSAALMQFGQALGSGVLQGDEFRSMAEAAPQYLDELSKAMGIPRENLKKMAADGKLTAKAVIEATQKMAVVFDTKFKMMPMTVGRAMTMVQNRFAMAIDHMNRKTMFVTKIAATILSAFDKIEQGISWLIEKFGGLDNMLRMIGITIGVVIGSKAVKAIHALRGVAAASLLPFIKLAAIIAAVALAVEDLYVWVQGGDSLTGKLIGPWEEWRAYVMGAWEMLKEFVIWIGEAIGAIAAMLVGAFTLDWALFKEGFMGLSDMVLTKVGAWATAIYDMIAGAFTRLGSYLGEVFLGWAMSLSNALTGAFGKVKSFLGFGAAATGSSSASTLGGNGVAPAQLAPSAMGAGRPNVSNSTQVNVTVPPGTSAEQAKFLETSAQRSFEKQSDAKMARDMAVYAS
jgi:tape measure domain-containing protein